MRSEGKYTNYGSIERPKIRLVSQKIYKSKSCRPNFFKRNQKRKYTKSRLVELQGAGVNENIKSNYNENCKQQKIVRCGKKADK